MTDDSRRLIALAQQIASAYRDTADPRAILLAGSAAEGISDAYSDLDLILYYDHLPDDGRLTAARTPLQISAYRQPSGRSSDAVVEEYVTQGVECQLLHTTIAEWERQMATVLEQHSPTSLAQKALSGLLDGMPIHGDALIARWQSLARAYPDGLARAMVLHHLRCFPLWQVQDRLVARDATIWYHQILVESSQNILGILAGLNRVYHSPFQFKRQRTCIARLPIAPDDLADRLDRLFVLDRPAAAIELERLVAETLALVEAHLPVVDTAPARRLIGLRQRPWSPEPEDVTSEPAD